MYIYIHIPFCSKICHYCDFPKILYDKKYIMNYLNTLKQEIKTRYKNELVKSIYIGGGTPTSLDIEELKYLLEITNIFKREEKMEFTIESNIESLSIEKIKLLKSYGINRISLGVQSFHNDTLKELGRNHNKEMVINLITQLKKYFSNISMDYIYGVNSSLQEIKEDIEEFIKLDIPHISCYSLIIEKGTIFGIKEKDYIAEDLEYQMYLLIEKTLTNKGYLHYEISNYSKDNYQSIHNLNYWNNGEYYGFGLGAVSYLNHYRMTNTKNFTKYLKNEFLLEQNYEDINTRISNELILGLRKINGIDIKLFQEKYQKNIIELYNIKDLLKEGKLEINNNYLKIPSKYFYLANEILINFV